jgi:hypothetical protein
VREVNMNKPTPGPWQLDGYALIAADGEGVGITYGRTRKAEEEKANAALIVAAVNACFAVNPDNPLAVAEGVAELVEACRNIAKLFDEAKEQGYSISAASNSWADALGAALAKLEAK